MTPTYIGLIALAITMIGYAVVYYITKTKEDRVFTELKAAIAAQDKSMTAEEWQQLQDSMITNVAIGNVTGTITKEEWLKQQFLEPIDPAGELSSEEILKAWVSKDTTIAQKPKHKYKKRNKGGKKGE